VLSATTRLVALLGHPVAHSLSPRMQNAAFAARGLDWAYVAHDVEPERLADAVRGLVALGFAGANVTIPHKAAVLAPAGMRALVLGAGGAARAVVAALEEAGAGVRVASRSGGGWPPDASAADLVVNATPVKDEPLVDPRPEQQVVDLAYLPDGSPTALVAAARAAGCRVVVDGLEVLVRQGAASFERWTGMAAPVEVMRAALRL
jgi:shikimate dehydrogenase